MRSWGSLDDKDVLDVVRPLADTFLMDVSFNPKANEGFPAFSSSGVSHEIVMPIDDLNITVKPVIMGAIMTSGLGTLVTAIHLVGDLYAFHVCITQFREQVILFFDGSTFEAEHLGDNHDYQSWLDTYLTHWGRRKLYAAVEESVIGVLWAKENMNTADDLDMRELKWNCNSRAAIVEYNKGREENLASGLAWTMALKADKAANG